MDTNNRDGMRGDVDPADQANDGGQADPAASALIGTNIIGLNTASYPGGIVAPAAGLAAAESAGDGENEEKGGALDQSGPTSAYRRTGDQGVSDDQSELEAGELNG